MGKDKKVKARKADPEPQPQQSKIWQDERFQHLVADPRFKNLPKEQRKVKIDKRFQTMFTDEKFKVKYTVDKYGRRVNKSNSEDLRKYYELDENTDSDAEDEKEEEERRKEEQAISRDAAQEELETVNDDGEPGENDILDSDGEVVSKSLKERLFDPEIDYARGDGRLITDSSSDDETEDEEDEQPEVEHFWGELDADAEMTEDSTRRLALLNMDWDRIRAIDIMVLLSSFLPPGGSILSVKIYPSEFGKERLAEEELHGPQELVGLGKNMESKKKAKEHKDDLSDEEEDEDEEEEEEEDELVQEQDSDAEEGDDYHMEKLRQYQLNRLRYYYAVVECDSIETADKIYKECDGLEYESSATRVDLRFIPDDTSFDEDEPTDVCTDVPDAHAYKPRQFTTTALQQGKVDLTWDETAVERRELGDKLASGKLDDVSDRELRQIVAYSSEEDNDDDDSPGDDDDNDDGGDDNNDNEEAAAANANGENEKSQLQSTGETVKAEQLKKSNKKKKKEDVIGKYKALLLEIAEKEEKEKSKKYEMEFSWDVTADAAANAAKDSKDVDTKQTTNTQQLTPIEKVLQKRNEKNKKRKEERRRKKLQGQGLDPDAEQASDSDSDSVPDGIDLNDPYFAEEFANGKFEQPKATKKQKKKATKHNAESDDEEAQRQAKELELLLDDDDEADDQKQHFSLEQIMKNEQQTKSKRKRQKQLKKPKSSGAGIGGEVVDNFQINLNDDRFKAIYTSHNFNIDPTDSHFKKTKGMEEIIQEKLKRRHAGDTNGQKSNQTSDGADEGAKRPRKQLENTLLVKSLKRKLQAHKQ